MSSRFAGQIPQRVHLVGVGGIHMSGIARILRSRGHIVSGSDLRLSKLTDELQGLGVTVYAGHDGANVGEAGLVVYTSAAHEDNPELAEALRRNIPTIKRAEMVARLSEGKEVIAVAGSHGKTTTSSLIAYMLVRAGLSPTYMLGGEMVDLGTSTMPGEGPHFVVEADEFDAAFLNYRPDVALVTNIEPDHLDFYGSYENLADTFRQFLCRTKHGGHIIACGDDPGLAEVLSSLNCQITDSLGILTYGLGGKADWKATNISQKSVDRSSFVVEFRQEVWGVCEMLLPGIHNISNALGALAVGQILGLPRRDILEALASFRGARRRFETVGEAGGVRVMDDYAHHPTEVRATLAAARARFPGRRLVCLFQPHTYTRTSYLLEGFRTCFRACDDLLIADTYAAREDPSAGMNAEQLAREISGPQALYSGNLNTSAEAVLDLLRPGDVFFTIGAGDVDQVGRVVLEDLKKR